MASGGVGVRPAPSGPAVSPLVRALVLAAAFLLVVAGGFWLASFLIWR
jgi:hypothetical protein